MERLIKKSSLTQSQIVDVLNFMKNKLEMEFIVIGGAAYSLRMGFETQDIDVIIEYHGYLTYNNYPDDYFDKLNSLFDSYDLNYEGELTNFVYKGINVDLLTTSDGMPYFQKDQLENINGFQVIPLKELLSNDLYRKTKIDRVKKVIKEKNLPIEYVKEFDEKLKFDYIVCWEEVNGVEFDIEKTKQLINL